MPLMLDQTTHESEFEYKSSLLSVASTVTLGYITPVFLNHGAAVQYRNLASIIHVLLEFVTLVL
jgi:hypothetical protein